MLAASSQRSPSRSRCAAWSPYTPPGARRRNRSARCSSSSVSGSSDHTEQCPVGKPPGPALVAVSSTRPSRTYGDPSASLTSRRSRSPSWPNGPSLVTRRGQPGQPVLVVDVVPVGEVVARPRHPRPGLPRERGDLRPGQRQRHRLDRRLRPAAAPAPVRGRPAVGADVQRHPVAERRGEGDRPARQRQLGATPAADARRTAPAPGRRPAPPAATGRRRATTSNRGSTPQSVSAVCQRSRPRYAAAWRRSRTRASQVMPDADAAPSPAAPMSTHCGVCCGVRRELAQHQRRHRPASRRAPVRSTGARRRRAAAPGRPGRAARPGATTGRPAPTAASGRWPGPGRAAGWSSCRRRSPGAAGGRRPGPARPRWAGCRPRAPATPTSYSRTQVAAASSSPPSQASGRWSRCTQRARGDQGPGQGQVHRQRDRESVATGMPAVDDQHRHRPAPSSTSSRGTASASSPRTTSVTSEQRSYGHVEHVAAGPQEARRAPAGSTSPATGAAWPARRTRTYAADERRSRPAPAG